LFGYERGDTVGAFTLEGKKALVTGASKGIGKAIALAYAEAGADVALVSRSAEALAEVAKEVEALGRQAVVIPADLTDRDAASAAVHASIERLGHLDIVVNNAGGSNFLVEFKDLRLAGWDKIMRLNLDSAMAVCHAVAPHLLERGSGSVINVASVAALGAPFLAPYAAAKAGVVALTKTLAVEWALSGVRVNALCPGWTATELNRNLWADEASNQATVANVPMRRWGTVAEMAQPAVFLAGDASAYMTGQVLFIDGGATAI
jgi:2-deoxy-D-gluconate 3-dehydrogenase